METQPVMFADLLKDKKVANYMIASSALDRPTYPDAQNFLQLLYGPNTGSRTNPSSSFPIRPALREVAHHPDSPSANEIYRGKSPALAYAPWRLGVHRIFNHLQYPWVLGYKKHPILYTNFKYLDVDTARQQLAQK